MPKTLIQRRIADRTRAARHRALMRQQRRPTAHPGGRCMERGHPPRAARAIKTSSLDMPLRAFLERTGYIAATILTRRRHFDPAAVQKAILARLAPRSMPSAL